MFKKILTILIVTPALLSGALAAAATPAPTGGSLSISVTPPLFQVSLQPGETWNSTIRASNPNTYPLTLYAQPMNFEPNGEEGHGQFTPLVSSNGDSGSLANWVTITQAPIAIAPNKSEDIPFTIKVPADAGPGGHYAAIVIGNQPPNDKPSQTEVKVSSMVSALLFLRIAGNVIEQGDIRTFLTDKNFYSDPNVNFTLRFENLGNVHLLPQGQITIYNMWGKERGNISINQSTDFGNVLPKSIRKFSFNWHGDNNLLEAGRYKAAVTLTYGTDARQNSTSIIYFWVIPVRSTLILAGTILLFFLLISWLIKVYVRKALHAQTLALGLVPATAAISARGKNKAVASEKIISKTKAAGTKSLAARASQTQASRFNFINIKNYIRGHLMLFGSGVLLVFAIAALIIYFGAVLKNDRAYKATIYKDDGRNLQILDGGQVQRPNFDPSQLTTSADSAQNTTPPLTNPTNPTNSVNPTTTSQPPAPLKIVVLNGTSKAGLANKAASLIKSQNYIVDKIGNAPTRNYSQTEIHYLPGQSQVNAQIAQKVANLLGNNPKIIADPRINEDIEVILGADFGQ